MAKRKPLMLISPEKAQELEADPAVVVIEHNILGDQMAVRLPTRAQWRKFKSDRNSESPDRAELANESLVLELVVFPEREEVRRYFEARAAAADAFAAGISMLAGFGGAVEKKDSTTS